MKVMCIKSGKWVSKTGRDGWGPQYGETCTVVDESNSAYQLAEYYVNPVDGVRESYIKKHFIPLSDIDETELVNELQTADTGG